MIRHREVITVELMVTGTKPVCAALPWNVVQSGAPLQALSAVRLFPGQVVPAGRTSTTKGTGTLGTTWNVRQLTSAHSSSVAVPEYRPEKAELDSASGAVYWVGPPAAGCTLRSNGRLFPVFPLLICTLNVPAGVKLSVSVSVVLRLEP